MARRTIKQLRIEAFLREHPDTSLTAAARRCRCSVGYVSKVRQELAKKIDLPRVSRGRPAKNGRPVKNGRPAKKSLAQEIAQEDMVNHPPHYRQGEIECIEAIKAALTPEEFRGYCKGANLKYTWREAHKGGMEDLQKALWYLDKLLEADSEAVGDE